MNPGTESKSLKRGQKIVRKGLSIVEVKNTHKQFISKSTLKPSNSNLCNNAVLRADVLSGQLADEQITHT